MSIFRAYDIRGIYGKELNEEIFFKIGKAIGTFLKGKEVCVGYDTRPSSPSLAKNLISGLISSKCDVVSLGIVPNPIAYFYAFKKKIFGCYITASHAPIEWNGVKIFKPNGLSLSYEELKKIEKIFNLRKFAGGEGRIEEEKNPFKDYLEFLREKVGKVKGNVLIDFLGGAGSIAKSIFKKMGLKISCLHEKPDASLYGFHRFEPGSNILDSLIKKMKENKFDFGVALDCDADRSFFVSSNGNLVDPSKICAIFIEDILKERKGKIVLTHDCASELKEIVEKNFGKLIWCRIGHNFIEKKVKEEKALFGAEESSHYYFNIFYPFSDGILSTLYLCKILNKSKEKFDELVEKIRINPIRKIYINAKNDENKIRIVKEFERKFKGLKIGDGIKIKLNESEWVIIRRSETMPEINLCVQAKNEKRLEKIVGKYSALINKELMKYG